MSWGYSSYGRVLPAWGHPLVWGQGPWGPHSDLSLTATPWGPYASPGRYRGSYVGATLDETYLKDTLDKKKAADTLFSVANPIYNKAFSDKRGYGAAITAVEPTIAAYGAMLQAAQAVLALVPLPPIPVAEAKTWATKYAAEAQSKITALESVLTALKAADPARGGPAQPNADANALLLTIATVAALSGGGALIGWFAMHTARAAIIGGGIGLAAGALSQASSWQGSEA